MNLPCERSGYCERGLDHEGACGRLGPSHEQLQARAAELEVAANRGELVLAVASAVEERDALVRELVKLFGWSDTSYLHAVLHVGNAVKNVRADVNTLAHELEDVRRVMRGDDTTPMLALAYEVSALVKSRAHLLKQRDNLLEDNTVKGAQLKEFARRSVKLKRQRFALRKALNDLLDLDLCNHAPTPHDCPDDCPAVALENIASAALGDTGLSDDKEWL